MISDNILPLKNKLPDQQQFHWDKGSEGDEESCRTSGSSENNHLQEHEEEEDEEQQNNYAKIR